MARLDTAKQAALSVGITSDLVEIAATTWQDRASFSFAFYHEIGTDHRGRLLRDVHREAEKARSDT